MGAGLEEKEINDKDKIQSVSYHTNGFHAIFQKIKVTARKQVTFQTTNDIVWNQAFCQNKS